MGCFNAAGSLVQLGHRDRWRGWKIFMFKLQYFLEGAEQLCCCWWLLLYYHITEYAGTLPWILV